MQNFPSSEITGGFFEAERAKIKIHSAILKGIRY
jgi:hypothetical protein